jgi:hypothetical protein
MGRSKFDTSLGWRKGGVGVPPAAQVPCTAEPSSDTMDGYLPRVIH